MGRHRVTDLVIAPATPRQRSRLRESVLIQDSPAGTIAPAGPVVIGGIAPYALEHGRSPAAGILTGSFARFIARIGSYLATVRRGIDDGLELWSKAGAPSDFDGVKVRSLRKPRRRRSRRR
jgi:hypothetical protein